MNPEDDWYKKLYGGVKTSSDKLTRGLAQAMKTKPIDTAGKSRYSGGVATETRPNPLRPTGGGTTPTPTASKGFKLDAGAGVKAGIGAAVQAAIQEIGKVKIKEGASANIGADQAVQGYIPGDEQNPNMWYI